MTLLLDIAPHIRPAAPETTGAELFRRFEDEPDTLAIAVVDAEGRPIGMVERNAFLVLMAAQHGYALWSQRPAARLMKQDPVVADGDVTVQEFCGRILEERPSELLHGFIVTCGGRYAGVGTTLALLQASAAATASQAEALGRLAWEANEALAAKGRFLAVMSHEIRTPLNGVLAVAEIMKRKSEQPDLAPFIETILESGGTLLRLLNDALDLSRAEAAGLGLDEAPLALDRLLDESASLWVAQAELKGLDLAEIARVLDAPDFDRVAALRRHRARLESEARRYRRLIGTIDTTLAALQGATTMDDKTMYRGFDPAKQAEHEAWLIDRYGGDMPARISESKAAMDGMTQSGFEALMAEAEAIEAALAQALGDGLPADSAAVGAIMGRHCAWVARSWNRTPTAEAFTGLGQLYQEHPEFRARYDGRAEGLTDYLAEAMRAYAARELAA